MVAPRSTGFGRKVMNLRKDQGAAQRVFAVSSAVTPSAQCRIESGQHQPRGPVAFQMARALGVTVDYLLDDSAKYPPPAREILANLVHRGNQEPRRCRINVSKREKKILQALRDVEYERFILLEASLAATRDRCRYAAFLAGAGAKLPGVDAEELREFKTRLILDMQELGA